jgi:phosphatidylethanolamine-binding protein (PEBP) family uncharacterized protein
MRDPLRESSRLFHSTSVKWEQNSVQEVKPAMKKMLTAIIIASCLAAPGCCEARTGNENAAAGIPASASAQTTLATGSQSDSAESEKSAFTISSPAVVDGKLLAQYRGEKKDENGVEKSIPLQWENVPADAKSLAVVMYHYPFPDDKTKVNSYLLLWGIDPSVTRIPYGEADDGPWYMGANKDGTVVSYTSPNSPNAGAHEYTITIYALSEMPAVLPRESTAAVNYKTLMDAINSVTIIGSASLTFTSEGGHSNGAVTQQPAPPPPPEREGN